MIEAFNRLERPLLIAGSGRDRERFEALANRTLPSWATWPTATCPSLMARSRAFVWPGEEDFGIAPIQAMAAGRPVIAYAAGGALDTVVPGTGTCLRPDARGYHRTVEAFDDATLTRRLSGHTRPSLIVPSFASGY
jgi:glycosyltransferase involved in cell wall biosynthesis